MWRLSRVRAIPSISAVLRQAVGEPCENPGVPRKTPPFSESHPDLAARWMGNLEPADTRTPAQFSVAARLKCWWWCGKSGHVWVATPPRDQTYGFLACPQCSQESREGHQRLMALPVGDVPALVTAWRDDRRYDGLRVRDLCGGVQGKNFGQTYALRCPAGHKIDTVVARFVTVGCPWCRGKETRLVSAAKTIATEDPELAATWHPTRNGDRTPENTPPGHRKPLWWKSAQCCGHEWQETVVDRVLGRRPQAGRGHYYCPRCESVWGSLAWLDPELAAEWHPDNDLTAWHVKPFSGGVVVKWRCSVDPEHVWEAAVAERSAGRLCPRCSTAGTSQVEKAFLAAAQAHDAQAAAARIGRWRVDVLIPSLRLVIEYDGEYWHRGKHAIDARKTRELLDTGFQVARVRENDLAHLQLEEPTLKQVSFRPAYERVEETVSGLVAWAAARHPDPHAADGGPRLGLA